MPPGYGSWDIRRGNGRLTVVGDALRRSLLAVASLSSNLDSTRGAFSCPNLGQFKHTLYQR
jgi:hypothetical protein